MNHWRSFVFIGAALFVIFSLADYADAAQLRAKSAFVKRALEYDRMLILPHEAPLDQHHIIAVGLAAIETQTTDHAEIAAALDQLSSLVTYLVQSDTDYVWDGISSWVPLSRRNYSYSGTKLTEMIEEDYDDQALAWNFSSRIVNTYDGNGRLATSTGYAWSGSAWVNSSMTTYTYDGSGNLTYFLLQVWQGGAWVNQFNSTMTYNGNLIATSTTQSWSGSAWTNFRNDIYSYNGSLLTSIVTQAWAGAMWSDAERTTYTYDGSNRMILALSERKPAAVWENWVKIDYAYDGATTNERLEVYSNWTGSAWDPVYADTSRYSNNKLSELVTYYFQFGSLSRELYTYDGLGNLVLVLEQSWNTLNWVDNLKTVYVYAVAGILDDQSSGVPGEYRLLRNYPNPFNMNTVIEYSLGHDGQVSVTVSNILGQSVRTLVDSYRAAGRHTTLWDGRTDRGTEVASGIYFLRVESEGIAQVRKMVLLK